MTTDDSTLALFPHSPRNRRTDVALRRLARETGAAAACDRRRCRRSRRCRGQWDPSMHDADVALPFCLMLKIDLDLDELQCRDLRLGKLVDGVEDACMAGGS